MTGRSGIALVGFMGSGKTTVARALGARLGWPVVDLDERLAQAHGPIALQVERDGWDVFRQRERAAALALCDGEARVLATGGGTLLDEQVRGEIAVAYRTVWLDVPLEVIAQRVGAGEGRPLWDHDVEALYAARRPIYATADLVIEGDKPVDQVVDEILRGIGS